MPSLNVDLQSLAVANLHADEEHRGSPRSTNHHRSVERFREARGGGIDSSFLKCQAWRLRSRSPT
jgi:hypothetical protein